MVSTVFDLLKHKVAKSGLSFTSRLMGKQPLDRTTSVSMLDDKVVYKKHHDSIILPGRKSVNGVNAVFFEQGNNVDFEPDYVWEIKLNEQISSLHLCQSGTLLLNKKYLLNMDFGNSAGLLNSPYKNKCVTYPLVVAPWSHFWGNYYDFVISIVTKLCRIEKVFGKKLWEKAKICYPLRHTHFEGQFFQKMGIQKTTLIDTNLWNYEINAECVLLGNNQQWFFPSPDDIALLRSRFCSQENNKVDKKIFISRSGRRRIKNEVEVRDLLKEFNFEIVEDRQRSVDEQIRIFSDASVVVGSHGAAFTNLIWCRPGTYVIELFEGGYTPPHYYYISIVLGLNYSYIVDTSIHKNHGSGTQNISFDMTVDVAALKREVKKILG